MERGEPADRHLIDRFLRENRQDLRGRVLEVMEDRYASSCGGDAVDHVDVVDIDASNPRATLVADLDRAGALPARTYDAIVLTQVVQYLRPAKALPGLYAALASGGTLLITVPGIARLDPDAPHHDLGRFTPAGFAELIGSTCSGAEVTVTGRGSLPDAVAVLLGLAADEIPARLRGSDDPAFPVIVAARVRRPASSVDDPQRA